MAATCSDIEQFSDDCRKRNHSNYISNRTGRKNNFNQHAEAKPFHSEEGTNQQCKQTSSPLACLNQTKPITYPIAQAVRNTFNQPEAKLSNSWFYFEEESSQQCEQTTSPLACVILVLLLLWIGRE